MKILDLFLFLLFFQLKVLFKLLEPGDELAAGLGHCRNIGKIYKVAYS